MVYYEHVFAAVYAAIIRRDLRLAQVSGFIDAGAVATDRGHSGRDRVSKCFFVGKRVLAVRHGDDASITGEPRSLHVQFRAIAADPDDRCFSLIKIYPHLGRVTEAFPLQDDLLLILPVIRME